MKPIAVGVVVVFTACLAACACSADVDSDRAPVREAVPHESTLVGRLLLPSGKGSRGVEITITEGGEDRRRVWVLFDEDGRFSHTVRNGLEGVSVTAGSEMARIDVGDLPELDAEGRIDVGVIDLRDRLVERRFVVRAVEHEAENEVRVAMWIGPPPVGPYGEPVSLGSRQFPAQALGSEWAWLIASDARSIHFLVELPLGSGRGVDWRSGPQRLFGPFTAAELPAELTLD